MRRVLTKMYNNILLRRKNEKSNHIFVKTRAEQKTRGLKETEKYVLKISTYRQRRKSARKRCTRLFFVIIRWVRPTRQSVRRYFRHRRNAKNILKHIGKHYIFTLEYDVQSQKVYRKLRPEELKCVRSLCVRVVVDV